MDKYFWVQYNLILIHPGSPHQTNIEVTKITAELTQMTSSLQKKAPAYHSRATSEPSEADINAAVAEIDMAFGDDEGSDNSLVPDGEKYVVANQKEASLRSKASSGSHTPEVGGSVRSTSSMLSQSGYVKPVEEISYG